MNDTDAKKLQDFATKSAGEIANSRMFLSLVTPHYMTDPGCMMQLGMAIAMGKPLYFLVEEGQQISEPLKRAARSVHYYKANDTNDLQRATVEAVEKVKADGFAP